MNREGVVLKPARGNCIKSKLGKPWKGSRETWVGERTRELYGGEGRKEGKGVRNRHDVGELWGKNVQCSST